MKGISSRYLGSHKEVKWRLPRADPQLGPVFCSHAYQAAQSIEINAHNWGARLESEKAASEFSADPALSGLVSFVDVKLFLGYHKPTAEGAGMDRMTAWHGCNMA